MSRLPTVGGDKDNWGTVLNDFLSISHAADGTLSPTAAPNVATIADLKALTPPSSGSPLVYVRSYSTDGDGGDGHFRWDATSTATDNGGTIIAPNAGGTGRWKRQFSGVVNVRWFGAVGDGVTDDTAAIQAAINLGAGQVFIPPSSNSTNYIITQLELPLGVKLFGISPGGPNNLGTRLYQKPGSNLSLIVPKSTIPANEWVHWVQISDMYLRGAKDNGSTAGCGIDMTRRTGENFLISNVVCVNFPESGIRLTRGSTPGGIFNCASFSNGQYGFDLVRASGDIWHQFTVQMVSGDNNELALIRLKTYGGQYEQVVIRGVKAEASVSGKQQSVIILEDCNYSPVRIEDVSVNAIVAIDSVVKITGTSPARLIAENFRMSHLCTKWINDTFYTKSYVRAGTESVSALHTGLWYGFYTDPSIYMKQMADYV